MREKGRERETLEEERVAAALDPSTADFERRTDTNVEGTPDGGTLAGQRHIVECYKDDGTKYRASARAFDHLEIPSTIADTLRTEHRAFPGQITETVR